MGQLGAQPYLPAQTDSLSALHSAAASCRGCELYREATQTVFGQGPSPARIMMVGEQPGDAEDREGLPFVGPAGRLLDKAITEAGLERDQIYLTNTVKHFKHIGTTESKRRIHAKPNQTEITACMPWLEAELKAIRPQLIVALGSTAAQALLGKAFRVTKERGKLMPWRGIRALASVHPSSILRSTELDESYAAFVADLRVVQSAFQSANTE